MEGEPCEQTITCWCLRGHQNNMDKHSLSNMEKQLFYLTKCEMWIDKLKFIDKITQQINQLFLRLCVTNFSGKKKLLHCKYACTRYIEAWSYRGQNDPRSSDCPGKLLKQNPYANWRISISPSRGPSSLIHQ